MMRSEFHSASAAETALLVDPSAMVFLTTGNGWILKRMYDSVCMIPGLYEQYIRALDIEGLKTFKKYIGQVKTGVPRKDIKKFMGSNPGISEEEAFAVLYGKTAGADLILDNPGKAETLRTYGVHVVRVSDMILALADMCMQEGGA